MVLDRFFGVKPLKQVIVVRRDVKMGKGKLAAQVAHAAVAAADKSRFKRRWKNQGQPKSVVRVEDLEALLKIKSAAEKNRLPYELIQDAGRTQIEPGTITCLGVGPCAEDELDNITGDLKLL